MARNPDWNDTELFAISLAYCILQQADSMGIKVNKSAMRRQLMAGPLSNRSNGSVEAKLMNCSAVAVAYGDEPAKGYKPAPNYQSAMRGWYQRAQRIVSADTAVGIPTDMATALEATNNE